MDDAPLALLDADATAAIEDACLAEVHAVLAHYGCRLIAVPEQLDDQVWTLRVIVQRRPEDGDAGGATAPA